jgi:hypothetical protein
LFICTVSLIQIIQYNKQTFQDTKGIIRRHKSKDGQPNGHKIEDTYGVIRSHRSNGRQHNVQKKTEQQSMFKLFK